MIRYEDSFLRHLSDLQDIKYVEGSGSFYKLANWDRSWKFGAELTAVKFLHVVIDDLLSPFLPLNNMFGVVTHIHARVICTKKRQKDQGYIYENSHNGLKLFLRQNFLI